MSDEACQVWVFAATWDMVGHACGRPVKRNGKCGIHARADEVAAANARARAAERAKEEAELGQARSFVLRLEALGVPCIVDWRLRAVVLTDPAALVARLTEGSQ